VCLNCFTYVWFCNVDAAQNVDHKVREGKSADAMSSVAVSGSSNEHSKVSDTILVHFEYGEEFARKIKSVNFSEFYGSVVSILENKLPGHIPQDLKFRCGKKWYALKENTGWEALCLDDQDVEIDVQATPTLIKLGKLVV